VTSLGVLLLLLGAAYLGGVLAGGHGLAGRGLASGSEWVVAGFVLVPALGLVSPDLVRAFAPVAGLAAGWAALVVGLDFGRAGERRIPVGRLAAAAALAVPPFAAVAAAVAAALAWLDGTPFLAGPDHAALALGAGAALAGTTRNGIRWAIARDGARGPMTDLLHDLSDASDVVPILALAGVGALAAPPLLAEHVGAAAAPALGAALGPALGALLGLGAALLVRFERAGEARRTDALAAILLGTSLVAIGLSARLGVSTLGATFALGLVASGASAARDPLRGLAARLERPILVPALLLAGAAADPGVRPGLAAVVAAALVALLAGKALAAATLVAWFPAARGAGPALAPALVGPGPFGVCVGLALALRFPGAVGGTVLACAAAAAVLGEIVSPAALRAALGRAGEVGAPGAGGVAAGEGAGGRA
jgi:hypothetical protein